MKYKNNLTLTNPRRVPFSLSNQFDDTFGLTDMVSDCKNAEDFCAAANKYDRFHLKWKIDKDSKNEPNHILQEFIKITRLPQYTYVTHIKCGRYDYQWYDSCNGAFGVGIF